MGILDDDMGVIRIAEVISMSISGAAPTLAKVKKSKLPDALALVNMNPPTAGPA